MKSADLEVIADAIARAAPREGQALQMQIVADVLVKGPKRQQMPASRCQVIAPDTLQQVHALWRDGDRAAAASALFDAFLCAYWPGMDADHIANIVWAEVKAVSPMVLTIDLVPGPLHGQSLANLLNRNEWERLRADTLRRKGALCEVCGARSPLECDEVWDYDDTARVARLAQLRIICRMCHRAKHYGRTRSVFDEQEVEAVIAHFCRVNGCDRAAFEAHQKQASELWWERTQPERGTWSVDFGEWSRLLRGSA